ncbi:hypothetical protein [Mycetocola saprophilus]|uniref:hypothetical protein n=1 Tax=Mycetocola saprophilus TaxID=76636 RepID=UPI0004C1CB95|nr:hypothetical protein [Mycetocola saprophilus]
MTDCVLVETGINGPLLLGIAAATILIGAALIGFMTRGARRRMMLGGALGLLLLVGIPVLDGSTPAQAAMPEHCVSAPATSSNPVVQPSVDPTLTPEPTATPSPSVTPSPTPSPSPTVCVPEDSPITGTVALEYGWNFEGDRIRFENAELNAMVVADPTLLTRIIGTDTVPETVTWSVSDGNGGRQTLHTQTFTVTSTVPRVVDQVEDGWFLLGFAEDGDTSNVEEIDAQIAAITAELQAQHPDSEVAADSRLGDYAAHLDVTVTGTNSCQQTLTGTGTVASRGPIPL